jgi:hypothetical protein
MATSLSRASDCSPAVHLGLLAHSRLAGLVLGCIGLVVSGVI